MTTSPHVFDVALPPFRLESGAALPQLVVRGWWWGPPQDADALEAMGAVPDPGGPQRVVRRTAEQVDTVPRLLSPVLRADVPTVLCVHALTGDARVGGPGGWWEPLIGPGRALDPRDVRVLCFANLGSCYGTSGPADEGFPRLADVPGPAVQAEKGGFDLPEGELPAPITTWDQARAILLALDALGVQRVDLTCGGSVGGMIVLALAALAPERFPALVPIATLDRATPWIIGWNHVGRQAIAEALRHGVDPARTLALARQIAHMTYRAGPGLMERHGRRSLGVDGWSARAPYAVQTYLEHQGGKLVARFDARAYVSQLDAMDHHDLGRRPPDPDPHETWAPVDPWPGLARVRARMDCVAIDSDELFFARDIHDMVVRYRLHGRDASWRLVQSPHGHDAFLMTWEPIRVLLEGCIDRVLPDREAGRRSRT